MELQFAETQGILTYFQNAKIYQILVKRGGEEKESAGTLFLTVAQPFLCITIHETAKLQNRHKIFFRQSVFSEFSSISSDLSNFSNTSSKAYASA